MSPAAALLGVSQSISRSIRRRGEGWVGVRKRQFPTTDQSFDWSVVGNPRPRKGGILKARISRPSVVCNPSVESHSNQKQRGNIC